MASGSSIVPGPYCELHAHSSYSLLDGVPSPEELAEGAARLRLPAIALTDHDALYGVAPFAARAQALGLKPIFGAELTLEDGSHLTLLAETLAGYRNLCRLISLGRANARRGQPALPWHELPAHGGGLICLTGCRQGLVSQKLFNRDQAGARQALDRLLDIFGAAHVYVELHRSLRRDDGRISRSLAALAHERNLKCVATGDVHYLSRADGDLQDVLASLRARVPLPQAHGPLARHLRPNHESFLRSPAAMYALYSDLPEAVFNTLEVAARCTVALPSGLQVLPAYPAPAGASAQTYLRRVCLERLAERYPEEPTAAAARLEEELALVAQLGLANYFLLVWDIVNFCQRRDILCHGRGSAASSLVAYLLGISAADPLAHGLAFERFISVEYGGAPDIDLDVDAARREAVVQYVYDRWGADHAALACTFVTYTASSALRDAGFALGFKPHTVEQIAQQLDRDEGPMTKDESLGPSSTVLRPSSITTAEWRRLVAVAERLRGRPRRLGAHDGALVVTGEPIAGLIPVEPAAVDASGARRAVVQFDKEHLEQLGIGKINLVGLRMLSAIADTLSLARRVRGPVTAPVGAVRPVRAVRSVRAVHELPLLDRLDFDDGAVYDAICSAHTIGLFPADNGAQVSVIPSMQPRCFQDLVTAISLMRPSPLPGRLARPELLAQGLGPAAHLHLWLKEALKATRGVIVFQEQVIQIAHDFAGFTPGRGERLRRAFGHNNALGEMEKFRVEFVEGAQARGARPAMTDRVWQMIRNFAADSFSRADAVGLAVMVYWSAWLRVHYPVEYFCALLCTAPLGTYPANALVSEARRSGAKFLPFDVNRSPVKAAVQSGAIRFGLDYVKGIGAERAEAIVRARGNRPFRSVADFVRRTGLERRAVEALALAGAFDTLGERRRLLWDLAEVFDIARRPREGTRPKEQGIRDGAASRGTGQAQGLPLRRAMPPGPKASLTFAASGVTAAPYGLVEIRRDAFTRAGCLPYHDLLKMRSGAKVKAGGLVTDGLRRPPALGGASLIRLEEPGGTIEVIVLPEVYAACREALRSAFVVVEGRLQKQGAAMSVVAERISAL